MLTFLGGGATFIQEATSIPDSRVNKSPISKTKPEPGPKPKTKLEPALKLRPSQAEQA